MNPFWTYWGIFALQNTTAFQEIIHYCVMHSNCFKEIEVILHYILQMHSRKQSIFALQNEFKERKYYCDICHPVHCRDSGKINK